MSSPSFHFIDGPPIQCMEGDKMVEFTCHMLNGDVIAQVHVESSASLRSLRRDVAHEVGKTEFELHLIVKVGGIAQEVSEWDCRSRRATVAEVSEPNGVVVFRDPNEAALIRALIQQDRKASQELFDAFPESIDNQEPILTAVEQNLFALPYVPASLTENRDFMLAAVKLHGSALGYAAPSIADDPEVTLAAIQENVYALRYASKVFTEDHDFMLDAVRRNSQAFWYASEKLKGSHEFLMAAEWASMQQNFSLLRYASKRFQAIFTKGKLLQEAARSLLHSVLSQNGDGWECEGACSPLTSQVLKGGILEDMTNGPYDGVSNKAQPRQDPEKQVLGVSAFDFWG